MNNYPSKPDEIPQDSTLCPICQQNPTDSAHYGVCQKCFDDGWRTGGDMIQAIRDDPEFGVDDDGRITVVPDYKKKWGK